MSTSLKLWLGFGTLTALLVLSVVSIAARLSGMSEEVGQSINMRAQLDLASDLEIDLANYSLAVLGLRPNPQEDAAALERGRARYEELAVTGQQRQFAARLATDWAELQRLGQAVIAGDTASPAAETRDAFSAARNDLSTLIRDEIIQDADAAVEGRRIFLREKLRGVFLFTLLVLAAGALLSVITSAAVGRGVIRDQRLIAEQAERLRTTLGSIGDAVITTDAHENVTNLNGVAEKLTGWTAKEATGQPLASVFRIVNEKTRQPVESPAARALQDGVIVGLANHTVLIAKDGSEYAIDDSAAPIRCKEGQVVGCVLVFRDVSDRRKAASALRKSESELSEFFENATVAIHWVGPDGTILRANQRELEMLGYTREEYIGRNIADFHSDQSAIQDFLLRLQRGETIREHPATLRCKDGSIRDVLINSNVLFEDGVFVHTRCFTRDVTELKLAQQAQASLAAIVESSDDAIIGISLEGVIQSWNAGAERIFGYTASEAAGRHVSLLIPPERVAEEDRIFSVIRTGGRVDHFESVRLRKDGGAVPVSLTVSPVRDESGEVVGASKIARDITAGKRADDILRESETRFRTLANSAPVLIWVSDEAKKHTWFNTQWFDFVGRSRDQDLGEAWTEDVHPDDLERCVSIYAEAFDRREPFQREYRLRRHDGEYRWVLGRGVPRFSSDGTFLGYVGSCGDVHDRVQAEEALRRKSSALETIHRVNLTLAGNLNLESLIESVTDSATALTRAKFGAFFYNVLDNRGASYMLFALSGAPRSAFEKFGLPRKTAVFAPTFDGTGVVRSADITKEPLYGHSAPHYGMPAGHLPVRSYLAVPVASRSGEVHGGLFFGHPEVGVFDEQDEQIVSGIAAQAAVAIDNARLYEQLRSSEERFRVLSETLPAIIWACGPDGRVFYVNPGWTEYTGQSLQESLGLGWTAVVDREDRPRILEQWKRSVETGRIFEGEARFRRRDGQYRWHFFRGTALRGADGAVTAWHGTSLDIQEKRSAEQALREADRRKDEFLATLSHELRNPLAPLSMGLEVLKATSRQPEKAEEVRAMMERQTRQLIRLVDDLLDVSRITRGKLELRRSTVQLSEIIASAIEASQAFIDSGAHDFTISVPADSVYVNADPNRLAQVISNLVINAAKYTPDGGRVGLTVERVGARDLMLTVTDTGIGIPSGMLESIFEMFAQIEGPGSSSTSGLGIGLTLVKSLVQMHGGSIEAHSAGPNQGSEFRASLPIVVESANALSKPPAAKIAPGSKTKRRVLVVDDNQTAAIMLGMVIEMLGNEVRTANDGRQAIDVGSEYRPEVVFMDLGMPNVDGYEAARQMRKYEWGKSALLVALTGWGQEEHKKRTKEAGFDHHLVKPGEFADLESLFAGLEKKWDG